jgi:thiol-disulfide isomerase/thioredoxin
MFSLFRAGSLAIVGALALAPAALASEGWIGDYDEAVKVAKAEHKDLFVDFTGSDWCVWCKRLESEVFTKEEFLTAIKKEFVLVALDFPRSDEAKAKVPNPKRNEELRAKHDIQGFPTCLLMTADGDVFGSVGYRPGGATPYVQHLTGLRTSGKSALTALDTWTKAADGEAKIAAWDKVADAMESLDPENVVASKLAPAVRSAFEFDKDNAKGKKKRAVAALLKAGQFDPDVIAAAKELDPKNEGGMLERVVLADMRNVQNDEEAKAALDGLDKLDTFGAQKDKETGFLLHAIGASFAQNLNDLPRAKGYAEKAKAIGSDNQQAMEFLDSVLKS